MVVDRAALLCKADLASGMVGEFPELQGIMGRYYALEEKLPAPIADAIGDHYAPAGPNDRCPSAPLSIVAALADKLDTLTSFWAIGEKPTGSRDPFALRRAAQVRRRRPDLRTTLLRGNVHTRLGKVESGEWPEQRLLDGLDSYLERDHDRALFGLPPKQEQQPQEHGQPEPQEGQG